MRYLVSPDALKLAGELASGGAIRLAGAYGVANVNVFSLRAVCGRRSIPTLGA